MIFRSIPGSQGYALRLRKTCSLPTSTQKHKYTNIFTQKGSRVRPGLKSPVPTVRDCQFSLGADLLLVSASLKPGLVSS